MPMATKEAQREYQREWRAARRAEWFEGKCCVICGSTSKLEIDHKDPKTKIHHQVWSWAKERRDMELAKCQVLCYKCHKNKTKIDRKSMDPQAHLRRVDPPGKAWCCACKKFLPTESSFYKNRAKRRGLENECKACRSLARKRFVNVRQRSDTVGCTRL